MSQWGRAQDALWDRLYSCEDVEGKTHPGPLYEFYKDRPAKEFGDLVEEIVETVASIFSEPAGWADPNSDPVGDVKSWQELYKEEYLRDPYPDFHQEE